MAIYDSFAPPVNSTGAGLASNPASTGVVIAVIDSTQVGRLTNGLSGPRTHAQLCRLTALLGGNSSFMWRIEQSASSTITDAPRMSVPVFTPAHQTGQYSLTVDLQPGDLVRARGSDTGTGTFTAFLQLDPLA
jgi:hypothetical protein